MGNLVLAFEFWSLNNGLRSTAINTQISFDSANWLPLVSTVTPVLADNLGWRVEPHFIVIG
jgi:hypothetical protein